VTEHRIVVDGVTIVVDDLGSPTAPAVMVLHGFAGSAATVAELVDPLVDQWRVLVPDLVGHGRSDAPERVEAYEMDACVDQLEGVCASLDTGPLAVVGYSMGARVALQWVVRHPGRVTSMITVGATPGLLGSDEREARVEADRLLADRIESDGVEWFANNWPGRPIFATQATRVPSQRQAELGAVRRGQRAVGLANSLRGMGSGAMRPLRTDELAGVEATVLVLAGADDAKFVAIGRRLAEDLPRGRFEAVANAGHAAHLEQPVSVARLLVDGLR